MWATDPGQRIWAGVRAGTEMAQAWQQSLMAPIHRHLAETQTQLDQAKLNEVLLQNEEQKAELARTATDRVNLSPWLQMSPEQRSDAPTPATSSRYGDALVMKTEQNDAMWTYRKSQSDWQHFQIQKNQEALDAAKNRRMMSDEAIKNGVDPIEAYATAALKFPEGLPSGELSGAYRALESRGKKPESKYADERAVDAEIEARKATNKRAGLPPFTPEEEAEMRGELYQDKGLLKSKTAAEKNAEAVSGIADKLEVAKQEGNQAEVNKLNAVLKAFKASTAEASDARWYSVKRALAFDKIKTTALETKPEKRVSFSQAWKEANAEVNKVRSEIEGEAPRVPNSQLQPAPSVNETTGAIPDIGQARQEAYDLIKAYPGKASAIKNRFSETFKKEL